MAIPLPPPPKTGGHYVRVGGKPQLIHAIGLNKWAPGPPKAAKPAKAARPAPAAPNPLLYPSQPLSGPALQQAAQSLTDTETKGPLAELATQLARSKQQGAAAQKATAGYFHGLGNFVNQSSQQLGGISSGLNQQLTGIGTDTQNRLSQLGQQDQASMLAHAPQGEGGLSGSAVQSLASALAQQQGLAAQDSGTARAAGATQGANYQSLGATNLANYALRGQEALRGIANANQSANLPIQAKIADLNAQRGSLLAKNEGALRQQEIANAISQEGIQAGLTKAQIAAAQSGANVAATQAGANSRNAATISAANARNAATITGANSRNAATNATATLKGLSSAFGGVFKAVAGAAAKQNPPARPLSSSQNNSYWSRVAAGTTAYGGLRQAGESPQTIINALKSGAVNLPNGQHLAPMSDLQALAVYELWTYHYLNPQTAALLHRSGVRGGTYNGGPVRVGAPPAKQQANVLPGAGSLSQTA